MLLREKIDKYLIPGEYRGFITFLCRRSVGFFSRAFLVFLMKESKKRRRKQPGKLMAKSCSQPVNLPCARPLLNALGIEMLLVGAQMLVKVQEMPLCVMLLDT